MRITEENTQFFTFFAGIRNSELVCLETMAESFRRHYTAPLWVMDQHLPIQRMISDGERIFIDDTAYLENISSDLDFERLERFFASTSDFVQRIVLPKQFPYEQLLNETLSNHRTLPYALIMDSDIWLKNGDFFPDLNALASEYSEDQLFAAGYLVASLPFELPAGQRRDKHVLHKLGDWLIKHYGFHLRRAKMPGFEPNFFWINGELFSRYQMTFRNLHLYIRDTTMYGNSTYKLMGDSTPSVIFQAAMEGQDHHQHGR